MTSIPTLTAISKLTAGTGVQFVTLDEIQKVCPQCTSDTLIALTRDGLVTFTTIDGKNAYCLLPKGEDALEADEREQDRQRTDAYRFRVNLIIGIIAAVASVIAAALAVAAFLR